MTGKPGFFELGFFFLRPAILDYIAPYLREILQDTLILYALPLPLQEGVEQMEYM